jgi:hypothetical protein
MLAGVLSEGSLWQSLGGCDAVCRTSNIADYSLSGDITTSRLTDARVVAEVREQIDWIPLSQILDRRIAVRQLGILLNQLLV